MPSALSINAHSPLLLLADYSAMELAAQQSVPNVAVGDVAAEMSNRLSSIKADATADRLPVLRSTRPEILSRKFRIHDRCNRMRASFASALIVNSASFAPTEQSACTLTDGYAASGSRSSNDVKAPGLLLEAFGSVEVRVGTVFSEHRQDISDLEFAEALFGFEEENPPYAVSCAMEDIGEYHAHQIIESGKIINELIGVESTCTGDASTCSSGASAQKFGAFGLTTVEDVGPNEPTALSAAASDDDDNEWRTHHLRPPKEGKRARAKHTRSILAQFALSQQVAVAEKNEGEKTGVASTIARTPIERRSADVEKHKSLPKLSDDDLVCYPLCSDVNC